MQTQIHDLLRSLPELEPAPGAWQRVLDRYRESTGIGRHSHPLRWLAAAACIAGIAIAVLGIRPVEEISDPISIPSPRDPLFTQMLDPAPSAERELQILRRRSQHMERMLRGLPRGPELVRADTAGAISELQDRIAALDYQLNRMPMSPETRRDQPRELWQQRVDLMGDLVQVRYAESGVDPY